MEERASAHAVETVLKGLPEGPARRAALGGAAPQVLSEVDAVASGRRGALTKVQVEWIGAALVVLGAEASREAVAKDRRVAAREALDRVHGTGEYDDGTPWWESTMPHQLRRQVVRHPGQMREVLAGGGQDLTSAQRDTVLSTFLEMSAAWTAELEPAAVRLFCGHVRGELGGDVRWLPTQFPTAWWKSLDELNAHAVRLLWDSDLEDREHLDTAAVCAAVPMDAGAVAAVQAVAADATCVGQFQILEAAQAVGGFDVELSGLLHIEEVEQALSELDDGPVRDAVTAALTTGQVHYDGEHDVATKMAALGAPASAIAVACDTEQIERWLTSAVPGRDQVDALAATMDAEDVVELLEYLVPGSDIWSTLVDAAFEHTARLLDEVSSGAMPEGVRSIVLARVYDTVGDDEGAWAQLWQMVGSWPGSVRQALDCLEVCHS